MPDTDQPPERGRAVRRALKTRQRLLESALYVFSQQGVDACSIEDITERADVGKGTFYRHFHDKLAILLALSEAALLDLSAAIRARTTGAVSLPDALDRIQASQTDWCIKRADCFRLLLQAQALLVVRPQAMMSLQTPFRTLVADVESMLRQLAPAPTDDAAFRRTVLATLSKPFGALALQQAVFGMGQTDAAETPRFVAIAASSSVSKGIVAIEAGKTVAGG